MIPTWREVSLGDAAEIQFGFPFKSADFLTTAEGPRLLRGDNIGQGQLRWANAKFWPEGEESTQQYQLSVGDLVLAMDRPWIEAGLKYAVVRHHDLPALLVQRVARLRARPGVADGFLQYVLADRAFTSYVLGVQTGTAVPHISGGQIRAFKFALPPLDEQRRIAEVLGALDDLIDTNNRSISSTEALLQAQFEAMSFDSPGGVPLVDRVELNPSYPKPKGIAPYVDMAALPTNSFFIEEVSSRPAAGGTRFMRDDVLLARITPCLENGKAAFTGNLAPGEVYVGSTEFIVMRAKQGVPSAWPYFLARSERFREFAIRHMTGSSGRQRLAAGSLQKYEVGGDSDALLGFDRLATPLLLAASELSAENALLRRTRDELLPLLMSGAVRVRPEGVAA